MKTFFGKGEIYFLAIFHYLDLVMLDQLNSLVYPFMFDFTLTVKFSQDDKAFLCMTDVLIAFTPREFLILKYIFYVMRKIKCISHC